VSAGRWSPAARRIGAGSVSEVGWHRLRARAGPTIGSVTAPIPNEPTILDGNRLRDETVVRLRAELATLGDPPVCLATVLVGDDGPSQVYVRNKHRQAERAGMQSRNETLPAGASQAQVEDLVARLAADPSVHGILVQSPLPGDLDFEAVLTHVPPDKDVDGLTDVSLGRLVRGQQGLVPCTPLGVVRLLERYGIETVGKRAVVVGRSTLVGLPLALLLARKGIDATVTVAHSRTNDLVEVCNEADIVIAAAGQARMIGADHVRPGATVIDVGISRTEAGIVGDVDFDAVCRVAGAVTPMPGGTGPMTIACLLENTLTAARLQGALPPVSGAG
jgi:methylenetetrahydrofolate dehydrogenase (NADP+) / methenyltetrahydrofolate cyclohydrolase